MAEEAKEKCAVAAVVGSDHGLHASELVYEELFAMQHRGAEASGMASSLPEGGITNHRDNGVVVDVYKEKHIRELAGSVAIGHNRYSTSGSKKKHMQPFVDEAVDYALAHNGNLPVTERLEGYLAKHNISPAHINDSEMMGHAIGQRLRKKHDLPTAIERSYSLFEGAFSCVALHDGMVVAFRDPKGIRPLALGKFDGGYAVSSETSGLDIIDAAYEREIEPGEMVIITKDGIESKQIAEGENKLDMFEFVYFARHDSQLYGQRVNEVRRKFGEELADQHPPQTDDLKNIVVVPIPDTSTPAAEGYAEKLGLSHRSAVIKNRYIGRTFMLPNHTMRKQNLRRKHNIIPEAVDGKDVIFMDDSIVRLNTYPRLVKLAYMCGARSVSALIASPPVRFPDYYGIDTPSQSELAAANMTVEQMRQKVGSSHLGFLSLSRMVRATGLPADMFNLSCFTGEYPIDIGSRKKEISAPVSMEYID